MKKQTFEQLLQTAIPAVQEFVKREGGVPQNLKDITQIRVTRFLSSMPRHHTKQGDFSTIYHAQLAAEVEMIKKLRMEDRFVWETNGLTYLSKEGAQLNLHTGIETFGNCQNFTMGYFEDTLHILREKELVEVCEYLGKEIAGKPLLIIDVHSGLVSIINKLFDVIFTTQYDSTNGSDMTIMMIKLYEPPERDDD